MKVIYNGAVAKQLKAVYSGEDIWIGIDSSKRNTAIAVGTSTGKFKDIIELDGKDDGTGEYEYLALCKEQRRVLKEIFEGAIISKVGIEDIITKGGQGIYQHMSRFAITAVFMSLIIFFEEVFNIEVELINNNTWKTAILPKEYRGRDVKKGARLYLRDLGHWVGNYPLTRSDPADAYCILEYLYQSNKINDWRLITTEQEKHCKMQLVIGDYSISTVDADRRLFNVHMPFEVNCRKAISVSDKVIMRTPIYAIPHKYIWTRLYEPFNTNCSDAYIYLEVKND